MILSPLGLTTALVAEVLVKAEREAEKETAGTQAWFRLME